MGFLSWLEGSPLGLFILESIWGYPITLSLHGVGFAIVVGTVVALNMRVLGYAKGISILAFDKVFTVAWVGFFINLITGIILYSGYATSYTFQGSFQLKLGAILVGGVLLKVVMNSVRAGKDEKVVKMYSAVCLLSWVVAVVTGRLMAYL